MRQIAVRPLSFQAWVASVPEEIKDDALWTARFYQKALFLYELCWLDCKPWYEDIRGRVVAAQIIRSSGPISANIEEGYGRGFRRDYARFLTIAAASARETKGWYFRARYLSNQPTVKHRIRLCNEIIGMLVPIIKQQRAIKK